MRHARITIAEEAEEAGHRRDLADATEELRGARAHRAIGRTAALFVTSSQLREGHRRAAHNRIARAREERRERRDGRDLSRAPERARRLRCVLRLAQELRERPDGARIPIAPERI